MPNATLIIILKVKDEAELFSKWVEYHAAIVGYENLRVFDCGSTKTPFLEMLNSYSDRVFIQRYSRYYDDIHQYHGNEVLYDDLVQKCKYVMVLDCDEFLFASRGGSIHPSYVLTNLDESFLPVVCGTWFNNTEPPSDIGGQLQWRKPLSFAAEKSAIFWGSRQGKAIVRADLASEAKYIGHNTGDKRLSKLITGKSFGEIGVFHLSYLGLQIAKKRSLHHLTAKGIVHQHFSNELIDETLRRHLHSPTAKPIERLYISRYFGIIEPPKFAKITFRTMLLNGGEAEVHEELNAWTGFDYEKMLAETNTF